jgi:hypothetical protein
MEFFHLSLAAANAVFGLANVSIIIGTVLVLSGTIAAIWSSGIKERFADERTSANEAETSRAKAEAATANARAAEATARANEAALQLARLRAPRTIEMARRPEMIAALSPFAGLEFDLAMQASDPEAESLCLILESILVSARWSQVNWTEGDLRYTRPEKASVGLVNAIGVAIQVSPANAAALTQPATTLCGLLNVMGVESRVEQGLRPLSKNPDTLHILVAKKPN